MAGALTPRIHELVAEVRSHERDLEGDPSDEGALVRMAAAAMLARSLDLLAEALKCSESDARDAAVLVMRTVVEVTLRGRFLLTPEGALEHRRMVAYWDRRSLRGAERFGLTRAPLGVLDRISQTKKPPLDLATIAARLDKVLGLELGVPGSIGYVYDLFYGFPSLVVVHGGLGGIKRYTTQINGRLRVLFDPSPPLVEAAGKELLVAGLCGDLAVDVFREFGIGLARLNEINVRMPKPEDLPDRI